MASGTSGPWPALRLNLLEDARRFGVRASWFTPFGPMRKSKHTDEPVTPVDSKPGAGRFSVSARKGDFGEILESWLEIDHIDGWTTAYGIRGCNGYAEIAEVRVFPRQPDRIPARTDRFGRSHGERARRLGETLEDAGLEESVVPRGGLKTDAIRSVRTEEALVLAQKLARDLRGGPLFESRFSGLARNRPVGRHRPHRRNDAELIRIVETYIDIWQSGSQAPVAETAKETGYAESTWS